MAQDVIIVKTDLPELAKSRVEEAEILLANRKFDAASYLCGYAVELALKFKICERFQWSEYPPQIGNGCRIAGRFFGRDCFTSHDLATLLCASGMTKQYLDDSGLGHQWNTVVEWNPENRYKKIRSVNQQSAEKMIEAVKGLLEMFLE